MRGGDKRTREEEVREADWRIWAIYRDKVGDVAGVSVVNNFVFVRILNYICWASGSQWRDW